MSLKRYWRRANIPTQIQYKKNLRTLCKQWTHDIRAKHAGTKNKIYLIDEFVA